MLWQRASSQSPCGVRMLIECNHRNPRGLAPGSSQFVAFYIVVFLYGIELMMFHIGIVLVSYLIEKETDTKTAKIYRSMMVYSKQNIFLLLYGYNECERRKAIENIDSFFRKHKLLRVFAA